MSRNLSCGCLCHGSAGNRIGDEYFSCKNCYAANHMNNLPRLVPHQKAKPSGPRKPRAPKPTATAVVAKAIMNNIADAAQEVKDAQ